MNTLALALASLLALSQDSESDRLRKEAEKLKADQAVLLRQLEVCMAQIQELNDKLTKAQSEKKLAVTEHHYSRQQGEKLSEDLAQLEEKHVELARQKKLLEQKFLGATAPAPAAAPRPDEGGRERDLKALLDAARLRAEEPAKAAYPRTTVLAVPKGIVRVAGKVTAVANEINLVVLSVGSDGGVREGEELTVYRGGEFVAKVVVDRVSAKWSAAKVALKKQDPRVADDVSNQVFLPGPTAPLSRTAADEVQSLRKELDEVRLQVRQLSDRVLPAWQEHGLAMEGLSEALLSHLRIHQGILIRDVREGSPAAKLGLKPLDIVPDLGEVQFLKILKEGGTLTVYRQGTLIDIVNRKR